MNPSREIVFGMLWIPFVPIAVGIFRILVKYGDWIRAEVRLKEEELRGLRAHHRDRWKDEQLEP